MTLLSHTELLELDAQYCWHPFTQMQTATAPLAVVRGQNEFLFDAQGKKYFDAVSSWWVNIHGHSHPAIAQAIARQAAELEHVMFAGVTHPPAALLAQQLIQHAPTPMAKVFYSDNGSTAIEVALKMAFQYWQNKGVPDKKRIIALEGGYHGDTFGAMAAGKSSGFYDPFKPWLFEVNFIPTGVCHCTEEAALATLNQLLEDSASDIAALILEPLIQGASGMRFMRPAFVAELCKRCKAADVLVIFDEVFTAFGRTGTLFAADQVAEFGGQADMICISKGLTGGFMPMAATLTNQAVYDAFLSDEVGRALLHGHSYTANPLGCAAALASLALFSHESTWASMRNIEAIHQSWLPTLACHPWIENPRVCGTVAAFELKSKQSQCGSSYGSNTSQWIRETFLELGIVVRPLGNTVYWVPPYCTAPETLENAYQTLMQILQRWGSLTAPGPGSELF
ncbi:adenosylmethionine-8-amino-7-oxononanoate aminotransferase [Limnobacter thiooxidans]|uniref:Adenosylmethionine-8-amino-7-oxononanoate aminotransferase n=1 Tax=Limnobacter thiooxidans TaxID=131080 RepID=A0AA86MJ75_9BURK|nr:adenosylmethionine--8-amino-7-oxononanoate transaminase [Limnobacter sp.]MCZ8014938.1 adenosylmethionine--8-amino-7-oxononanoate transaminase [Limnobacter sp.]RZS40419.1 adenosylmethionine-8-amino-7-oxononanoate aminotransferase [Limnobacter thiooxidans]BET27147.1 adenosylmethionine--8-amino-7-oxononanoate transaminase [Limnobacter thiooxidans]